MRGWFKGIILGVAVLGVAGSAVTLANQTFPVPITDDVVFLPSGNRVLSKKILM
ncbi:hypothetical protein ACFSTD_08225 [Novosphingobium colocasiae]